MLQNKNNQEISDDKIELGLCPRPLSNTQISLKFSIVGAN